MVSFKGSFVFCLFYLYSYGVVQGIFCFLLVLPWWLWCRSRDLLFFACFTLMVMVSFKGAFVFCLFYLYGYGVVQGIFYFLLVLPWWLWCRSRELFGSFVIVLLVLPWWLWCRSRDLLLFVCFIFIVMVSFKRSFIFCLFYLDGYGVVQGRFCLFYLYSYGVVQGIFYFLLVLPWWLWCRSRELLLFVCFIFIVMVSFKRSFIFCLFYLDGYGVVQSFLDLLYGVVQGIFYFLLVLPWWLWCRSRELLLFVCFIFIVMVSFKRSFIFCLFYFIVMVSFKGSFCLFYLDGYGVVQWIFLLVLPWWLWCRSMDLLFFVCFIFIVMVSFKGSFVFCLFYLYSYGVVQGIFCFLFVLSL